MPDECSSKRGEGKITEVRQDPQGTLKHVLGVPERVAVMCFDLRSL